MALRIPVNNRWIERHAPTTVMFLAGVGAVFWLVFAGGCSKHETCTRGLFDAVDAFERAGPWRWLFAASRSSGGLPEPKGFLLSAHELPRFLAGDHISPRALGATSPSTAQMRKDGAQVEIYRMPVDIGGGEDLLVCVSFKPGSVGNGRVWTRIFKDDAAVGTTEVPQGGPQHVLRIDGKAAQGRVLVDVIITAAPQSEPPDLESVVVFALEDDAPPSYADKAAQLIQWVSENLDDKLSSPTRLREIVDRRVAPTSTGNLTLNTILMAKGDTLRFNIPNEAEYCPFSFWVRSFRIGNEDGPMLRSQRLSITGWEELQTVNLGNVDSDSWARVVIGEGRLRSCSAVRFMLSGQDGVWGIAEPTILPSSRAKQWHPNLVLIDLDTMRADRLGCYGYTARFTSARLDSIVDNRGFYIFTRAISPSPYTMQATAKFFTSRYLDFSLTTDRQRDYVMLAEILRQQGYYCAAFTGGGVLRTRGFEEGFHEYHWSNQLGKVEDSFPQAERWIQAWQKGPFFLFLHTYESHMPLIRDRFTKGLPRGRLGDLSRGAPLLPPGMNTCARLSAEEQEYVQAAYDGGVWAATEAVADLFKLFDEHDLWRNTVVIVLSDHGEEFWDHFEAFACHRHSLYGELLNVPFLLFDPSRAGGGLKPVDEYVSTVDLVPTVLSRLSIPFEMALEGLDLTTILDGKTGHRRIPILANTVVPNPPRRCIIDGGTKFIEAVQSERRAGPAAVPCGRYPAGDELYRLTSDPHERQDLSEEQPRLTDQLKRSLRDGLAHAQQAREETKSPEPQELPGDLKRQLRALGYLEGQ